MPGELSGRRLAAVVCLGHNARDLCDADPLFSRSCGWEILRVITRIETGVLPGVPDPRGRTLVASAADTFAVELSDARAVAVYKFHADLSRDEAEKICGELTDPVIEGGAIGRWEPEPFDWVVTVGFRPGVTDNVGRTAFTAAEDILGRPLGPEAAVYTETAWLLKASGLGRDVVERIAFGILANAVIQTVQIESRDEWKAAGPDLSIPVVEENEEIRVDRVDLSGDDGELKRISSEGILSLSLAEMKTIRDYFADPARSTAREAVGLGSEPTDAELEALAQTWSEHCKHKIFNATIRYREPGGKEETIRSLFNTYIKAATDEIGAEKPGFLVSVFHDNAGVVRFNEKWHLVYKVETHNSPSALDPYGGAITGIVGVNRDPFGTGRGAALLANVWGYCLGSPFHDEPVPEGLLHPRRIRDGVHLGVIDGGNQSGIPYARGFEWFDERYVGKPLVYCGTLGLMPHEVCGEPAHEKVMKPGYRIAMVGGRVGKDGIHGATFSSEELRKESPVQAVQIGDAFTQKKMTDFLLEARDAGLYVAITDNGAGGLSSSVGEMALYTGGCDMDIALAPCKYAGLQPWEILLSEAQERMTAAIPPGKEAAFLELARRRDVEATILGIFTDSGYFHVRYGEKTAVHIDMEFLHDGCPTLELEADWAEPEWDRPDFAAAVGGAVGGAGEGDMDLTEDLLALLGRLNICSKEEKSRQYDHEVKGLSVVKPFVGLRRDVPSDATVMMVEPGSREGAVLAEGINPRLSDCDTYWMVAHVIDLAVRRIVAAGGNPDAIAGLDNFCWPDPVVSDKTPDGKYKLAQLVRANRALYDFTRAFGVPCVSGKDSMKNDSVRGGVKISIPPTLLFSAVGRIDDVRRAVTSDFKCAGDAVYVLGTTRDEPGGSEYLALLGRRERGRDYLGGAGPRVDAGEALGRYQALHDALEAGVGRSAHAPSLGGIGVAFTFAAMGGELGCAIDLAKIPATGEIDVRTLLFGESNARFVVSVAPADGARFEEILAGQPCARVGEVTESGRVVLTGRAGGTVADLDLGQAKKQWKSVLGESGTDDPGSISPLSVTPGQAVSRKEKSGGTDPASVSALVITGYGLNCEAETAHALRLAGASVDLVHLNDIISGERSLDRYGLIALIGGFSFGDHIAAGTVYANRLKFKLADQIKEFVSGGNLLIGICNGFQTLAKLGILPGLGGVDFERRFTIARNGSGVFRDDWVTVKADERTPCVFTRGIGTVDLPIRHGEGMFFLRDEALLDQMDEQGLLALRYVDETGGLAGGFPHNPNGSLRAVAGVCDPTGRVFGLMPHPEAFASPLNHPQWPRMAIAGPLPPEGEGMRFFHNAVDYLKERL